MSETIVLRRVVFALFVCACLALIGIWLIAKTNFNIAAYIGFTAVIFGVGRYLLSGIGEVVHEGTIKRLDKILLNPTGFAIAITAVCMLSAAILGNLLKSPPVVVTICQPQTDADVIAFADIPVPERQQNGFPNSLDENSSRVVRFVISTDYPSDLSITVGFYVADAETKSFPEAPKECEDLHFNSMPQGFVVLNKGLQFAKGINPTVLPKNSSLAFALRVFGKRGESYKVRIVVMYQVANDIKINGYVYSGELPISL